MVSEERPFRNLVTLCLLGTVGLFAYVWGIKSLSSTTVVGPSNLTDLISHFSIATFGCALMILAWGKWARKPWAEDRPLLTSVTAFFFVVGGMSLIALGIVSFIGFVPRDIDFPWVSGLVLVLMGAFLIILAWGKWTKSAWVLHLWRYLSRDFPWYT